MLSTLMGFLKFIIRALFGRQKKRGSPLTEVFPELPGPIEPKLQGPTVYRAFTREFDVVVDAKNLDSVLGVQGEEAKNALESAWLAFENGLLEWRTTIQLKALAITSEIRQDVRPEQLTDTVVSLLVDQSGSMNGQRMLLAAASVDIAQDFLRSLGCRVEVLGFTTTSWHGGRSRRQWLSRRLMSSNPMPGRLCDLLHIIYSPVDDPGSGVGGHRFKPMLHPSLPKENIDGEALIWAVSRLDAQPQKRKILVVLSDGAPVDDATLHANYPTILHDHLLEVVHSLEMRTDLSLAALGIGFAVDQYYGQSSVIHTPEDIGEALLLLLKTALTNQKTIH